MLFLLLSIMFFSSCGNYQDYKEKRDFYINNKDMKKVIDISDFNFQMSGYGCYRVTYTNPATGKQWSTTVNDMSLIDATKNADEPRRKDLETLKRLCKGG